MKKIALVLLMGLFATGATFGHYRDNQTGIGFVGNTGWGSGGGYFNPGLSLKLRALPVFWGFFLQPAGDQFGLALTGDRYFLEGNLVTDVLADDDGYTYNLRIDWFAGLGAFANVLFGGDDTDASFAFGLRIPAGISWHIVSWAELALGIVPSLGVRVGQGGPGFHWSVSAEFAVRYWFGQPRPRENNRRQNGNGERDPLHANGNGNGNGNGEPEDPAENRNGEYE
ncbi:MAG: hypothetical protein FWD88_06110 [Treponema sp.]|nr:hypothetical protein [Treponema sp.]